MNKLPESRAYYLYNYHTNSDYIYTFRKHQRPHTIKIKKEDIVACFAGSKQQSLQNLERLLISHRENYLSGMVGNKRTESPTDASKAEHRKVLLVRDSRGCKG